MTRLASMSEEVFAPTELLVGGKYRHQKIIVASGAGKLVAGTVLGKITSGGKYLKSLAAAEDGSQTPDMILVHDVDASSADVSALAYETGDFNESALTLGTGHTVASIREGLRVKGIHLIKVG